MRARLSSVAALAVVLLAAALPAAGADIAARDLRIEGTGLEVIDVEVTTGIDIPVSVRTEFAGSRGDEAPFVEGLVATGELSGPGLASPITLETAPGHPFRIPGLRDEGTYTLHDVRLVKDGAFLQPATPPFATNTVANVLETSLRVRQLTAEELRARGITLDGRNYDVYEYTVSIFVDGEWVDIPFPVAIDPRTHEARPIVGETPYVLPSDRTESPPRWNPPKIAAFEFVSETELPFVPQPPLGEAPPRARPSIPAAIVIPNDIAVLHQFFAVGLMVRNGAPEGSSITLDSISATIEIPPELRVTKTNPAVSFSQPVPIVDSATGVTLLVAQAEGEAEWVLEALRTGTLTIEFDLRATYRAPGQPDIPLRASPRTSLLVHDPRFNITFSHPDVVRQGVEYSTFTFVSNMSPAGQSLRIASGLPSCAEAPGANVCRVAGTPEFHDLTIPPGGTEVIEYRLESGITGHAFASAGSVEGDAITAAVQLHMGVDVNGIPLSPATLVLPHYTRYLDENLVAEQLELLGLGYSLATAPLNQTTASFPRVIRTDVFTRATDLARAGQRVYLGEPEDLALFGANLALLGSEIELREWDDLRRAVDSGRTAQAALGRRLRDVAIATAADYAPFVDRVAAANAHREPFLAAIAHGAPATERPFKLALRGSDSGREYERVNDAKRDLPFADVLEFDAADLTAAGELAVIGRWTEDVELVLTPHAGGPITIELLHPAATPGRLLRSTLALAAVDQPVVVAIVPGQAQVEARTTDGAIVGAATPTEVFASPLQLLGGRQDLHLDETGHRVSVLFNRPISPDGDLRDAFSAKVFFQGDGIDVERERPIAGAAAQADGRVANLNFDHVLSTNARYEILVGSLIDPLTGSAVFLDAVVEPVVENDRPAGILFGHVLRADNTPVADAEVALSIFSDASLPYPDSVQYDLTRADGSFFFEYVAREPEAGFDGIYRIDAVDLAGKPASINGAVRLPGAVQFVNLVYLGRGSAEGYVRYEDGTKAAGVSVVVGSTMFSQSRTARADAAGFYRVENLPVGPLTFSATDSGGRIVYAANELRAAGGVVVQDLEIPLGEPPGTGSVRGVVVRSDSTEPVAGARVGIYSRGHAVGETYTSPDGRFEFDSVPAGFVTVLAAEWSVSRTAAAQDFDLRADATRELTMILSVVPPADLVRVQGFVQAEDPLHPNQPELYRRVANAVVQIEGFPVVSADVEGNFVFEGVPSSFAGRDIRAWDPVSGRTGSGSLPSPLAASNDVGLFIPAEASGKGTIRVRLLNAAGFPADGLDVFVAGFPKEPLEPKGDGIYELADVPVGRTQEIWAVATGGGYGNQYATATARVAFDGHVAALNLRLPGQGRVRVEVRSDVALITDVDLSYGIWSEADQALVTETRTTSTIDGSGNAAYAIFDGVPALVEFTARSVHPVHGSATVAGSLAFDGDLQTYTLQLDRLASVHGVVYEIDGRTPVPNASVRLFDGRQDQGATLTALDGSFEFRNLPAAARVQAIASITQDGIFRTGIASVRTPANGGAVENVGIVLRRQGSVEGRVVYDAYRVFDPDEPSKNVADDTPEDLADNAPVPLARFWLRELGFPGRSFGSAAGPMTADAEGRFDAGNVFQGSLRAAAWDPANQELRGNWTGELVEEGERVVALIGIGGEGVGSIEARVVDPNQANAPVLNAEVLLLRGAAAFDFGSTDGAGKVRFEQLPAGEYRLQAYSKAAASSGQSGTVSVVANEQAEVLIALEFIGRVSGEVLDPEKAPPQVAGSHVTLEAFQYETRTTTDSVGAFVFEGVREGKLELTARDPESNRRAQATRTFSAAEGELTGVTLELERTETLHALVYLPADDGSSSGVLAPAVGFDIEQRCTTVQFREFCDFETSLQENPLVVPGMLANGTYRIAALELGGEQRTLSFSGQFPKGTSADPVRLVLPAFGSVRVQVVQSGGPAAGARVTASGGGRQAIATTDLTGSALLSGLRLGNISIQVRSLDGAFSGSAAAAITSQSTPATAVVELGTFAGITGLVEAEAGGPSIGTKVVATFPGRSLEVLTDGEGRFTLQGIPASGGGTTVTLTYLGPDQETIGAQQAVVVRTEHASIPLQAPPVRLDATPPRLLSIIPSDGATEVPPDTVLQFVFSEAIDAAYLTSSRFQLVPADSSSPVAAMFTQAPQSDGTHLVTLIPPPAPPGQPFRLRSNTLYRIIVAASVADLTGHTLGTTRGASFITSDYAEPRVARVEPPPHLPLQAQTTFRFTFNEPMDPLPWQPGGGGAIRLFHIAELGGAVVEEKGGTAIHDPAGPDTLVFGPADPIEGESYYRISITGARDLQGNVAPQQVFEWASFDSTPPHVTLISPVAAEESLISGVEYILVPDIRNGAADGLPATDVEQVEYFRLEAAAETFLTKKIEAPFSYRFVAPDVPAEGGSISFRAIARDRSLNTSAPATIVLPVRRNEPPANVAITVDPAEAYPATPVVATVTFEDEGTVATIEVTAAGANADASPWESVETKHASRASTSAPWPASALTFDLPPTLAGGSTVTFSARVTDVRGLASTASATVAVLADTAAPEILELAPFAETRYELGETFVAEARVRDLESGVAEVTFAIDGQVHRVTSSTSGGEGVRVFRSPQVTVTAKNVDTRVPIVATATDWQGN
ncbi:MAG: Ig-like domain-containing protein, partial [Thermoanaerobaculia bacterium]